MADPKFFNRSQPFSLGDLADLVQAQLGENADSSYVLEDVAALDTAKATDLSFLDNKKYKDQFQNTKAGACIVRPEMATLAPNGVQLLISQTPYKSYALAAQAFYPKAQPKGGVSEQAHISKSATISDNCSISPGVYIAEGVKIGKGCTIEANTVIKDNVEIGDQCTIGANVTLSHTIIGNNVSIYTGARIGQDGFGFAIDPTGHVKVPQLGRVIIEDNVEIGANTTIDRGAGPDTVIGQGTWIDNLVQIGHNAKIGKGCVIVAQVGISGSTVIEDFVSLGGQSGVAGHLTIGKGAQIAAQSGVMRDVPAGEQQMGSPAMPGKQAFKQLAALNRLIQKGKSS